MLTACSNPVADRSARKEATSQRAEKKAAQVLRGKVVGISDGDTFKLLVEGNRTIRVRLYGVDAPEKGQDYGTQARGKLSELLFSKNIEVEQKDKDRYGRVVGVAFVDGTNVNEELLRSGLVWHYTAYDRSEEWAALHQEAQK